MTKDDFINFKNGLIGVMSFYNQDLNHIVMEIWWESLKEYDLTAIKAAFGKWVSDPEEGQFAPKPASIIKLISGTQTESSLSGWAKAEKAVRVVGPYNDVVFDDPIIHAVIYDMGGWVAFNSHDADAWPFIQKEFETRYKGYKNRIDGFDFPKILIGISNDQNVNNGYQPLPPKLIGNPDKCKQVINNGKNNLTITVTQLDELVMKQLNG